MLKLIRKSLGSRSSLLKGDPLSMMDRLAHMSLTIGARWRRLVLALWRMADNGINGLFFVTREAFDRTEAATCHVMASVF